MRFFDWFTFAQQNGVNATPAEFVQMLRAQRVDARMIELAEMDVRWIAAKRPYYAVYPSIIAPLMKVRLDVQWDSLRWPLPENEPLVIRLPYSENDGIQTVLCEQGEGKWRLVCCSVENGEGRGYAGVEKISSNLVSSTLDAVAWDSVGYTESDPMRPINKSVVNDAWRLLVAICLIANDDSLVEPEPLSADAAKYSKTLDPKLIEKAIRRGKRGWSVGKSIESIPHLRRPHFGIRWTGAGKSIPKLVPVRGCVVRRGKICEVPTGYLGGDP